MISKLHLKWLINNQKVDARKTIASYEINLNRYLPLKRLATLDNIANERKFLAYIFKNSDGVLEVIKTIHAFRHQDISKNSSYNDCLNCKKILADMDIEMPTDPIDNDVIQEQNKEEDLKPRFGNLIAILEQEVSDEKNKVEGIRVPSQNDLTRWALKDAVLAFYQGLNLPENLVVVDTLYNDRLNTQLAPDFDVIARIWMEKLDELKRRDDKYRLDISEIDKAEDDLADGMRGSAFEKQLDRYREDFMQKLKR